MYKESFWKQVQAYLILNLYVSCKDFGILCVSSDGKYEKDEINTYVHIVFNCSNKLDKNLQQTGKAVLLEYNVYNK